MSSVKGYVTLLNINDSGAVIANQQQYRIETSQNEILKYFVEENKWRIAPEELIISIYERFPQDPSGERQILLQDSESQLTFFASNQQDWRQFNIPENREELTYSSLSEGRLILYLNNLKIYSNYERIPQETDEEYENRINGPEYRIIKELLSNEATLKIRYDVKDGAGDSYFSEKIIEVRNAMTEDMAKLAIKADGIYASVASSTLNFSADGLTIKNGGLKLVKHKYVQVAIGAEDFVSNRFYLLINNEYVLADQYNENSVYYYKEEENTLYGDTFGNLTLKGTIYATDGEFSGTINANSGNIGGFVVQDGQLSSIKYTDNAEGPAIVLNGEQGKIYADSIELGTGAWISEYLQLGNNVKIWNPAKNINKNFLEVTPGLTFNQNGYIILGEENSPQIKIDGPAREIRGWDPGTDNVNFTWQITPDQAVFNNIVARGSIHAATFEYGAVQAIGGTMLIRPSSRITSISGTEITIESTESGFEVGDICLLESSNGEKLYCEIEAINGNIISLKETLSVNFIGSPIVNLGQKSSIVIGINGSSAESYKIPAGAISVLEFDGVDALTPKIILGKLPDNQDSFGFAAGSYGLYAENVNLNGSLTTRTLSQQTSGEGMVQNTYNYSGIGTAIYSGAPTTLNMADRFPEAVNRGQILLWAGADNATAEGIQNSKFFVDEYGNMYAGSGYFDGTIITNSSIEAAEIKTMKLTGIGKKNTEEESAIPALIIQDVDEGIHFYKNNENDTTDLVFQLGANDFKVNGLAISLNQNVTIDNEGSLGLFKLQFKEYNEKNEIKNTLFMSNKRIGYQDSFIELPGKANIVMSPDSKNNFIIDQSGFSISGSLFYTYENKIRSEYKQVIEEGQIIGYDLYIY